jgi:hypothetical protein
MNEIPVKDLVHEVTRDFGFVRKQGCWYRVLPDLTQVIGLQKSRWGNYYDLCLGLSIGQLGGAEYPKIRECHIQARAEDFVEDRNELTAALNEEDYWKTDADSRRETIKLAVSSAQFYFFKETDDLNKVRNYLLTKTSSTLAVNKNAKDFFHLTL